ncbi:MAG: zinc-binding dehydrogenase [candidate division Zixibacteria bacterium]|nr:zinc-binding dehydrogenase [candidate division Zixibacteria bacterium]
MKALMYEEYGSPQEVLRLREIDKPTQNDDHVLVRVRAAGVDPGIWHLVTGLPYLVRIMGYGFSKPKATVPGWDLAGHVEGVGKNITQFKPGDAVFGVGNGSFAEYICTREATLAHKPANLSFEKAAAVHASGVTALQALRDEAGLQAGQSVLVIGAGGGVGTFTVQIAKAFGASVTGVCSTGKMDIVRSIGADHVIDYTKDDFTKSGQRYDVIIDTAGNRLLKHIRRALAPKGTLVIVGGEEGGRLIGGLQRSIGGMILSLFIGQRIRMQMPKTADNDLNVLKEMLAAGEITPILDRSFPLDEAVAAIRYVQDGKARGKVVVTM